MDDQANSHNDGRSAGRDGLAAMAVIVLTVALIVFVVSSLI